MKAWRFPLLLVLLVASACAPRWISFGTPPSGATRVSPLGDEEGVWVETNGGQIFSALLSSCAASASPCSPWMRETERPSWSPLVPPLRGPDCSSLKPGHRVTNPPGTVKECIYATTHAADTIWYAYYAVMSDGSVMYLNDTSPLAGLWIFAGP